MGAQCVAIVNLEGTNSMPPQSGNGGPSLSLRMVSGGGVTIFLSWQGAEREKETNALPPRCRLWLFWQRSQSRRPKTIREFRPRPAHAAERQKVARPAYCANEARTIAAWPPLNPPLLQAPSRFQVDKVH